MSDQKIKIQEPRTSAADLNQLGGLGRFLEENRAPERRRTWRIIMFCALGLLVVLNFIIHNHHPHFILDEYPLFWPFFGLGVGVIMVFFVKKIVQPLIKRPEDYYGDI